jgi:acetyltransferase-like isoleucine patch superfamily enzyme
MNLDSVVSHLRTGLWRVMGLVEGIDRRAFVHYTAEIPLPCRHHVVIERGVVIGKHVWINIPVDDPAPRPYIRIGMGTGIGRRSCISARNSIDIGQHCITGPGVLIMDHGHAFDDVTTPISHQGVTEGGQIVIEPGCWIGFGAAVLCNRGILRIGRNSVVGANAVVTSDVPPFTVVVGVPARPVSRYDLEFGRWVSARR